MNNNSDTLTNWSNYLNKGSLVEYYESLEVLTMFHKRGTPHQRYMTRIYIRYALCKVLLTFGFRISALKHFKSLYGLVSKLHEHHLAIEICLILARTSQGGWNKNPEEYYVLAQSHMDIYNAENKIRKFLSEFIIHSQEPKRNLEAIESTYRSFRQFYESINEISPKIELHSFDIEYAYSAFHLNFDNMIKLCRNSLNYFQELSYNLKAFKLTLCVRMMDAAFVLKKYDLIDEILTKSANYLDTDNSYKYMYYYNEARNHMIKGNHTKALIKINFIQRIDKFGHVSPTIKGYISLLQDYTYMSIGKPHKVSEDISRKSTLMYFKDKRGVNMSYVVCRMWYMALYDRDALIDGGAETTIKYLKKYGDQNSRTYHAIQHMAGVYKPTFKPYSLDAFSRTHWQSEIIPYEMMIEKLKGEYSFKTEVLDYA